MQEQLSGDNRYYAASFETLYGNHRPKSEDRCNYEQASLAPPPGKKSILTCLRKDSGIASKKNWW